MAETINNVWDYELLFDGVLEWIITIINYTHNNGHEELKSILGNF